MLRNNNRGFTLVELLVTIAIFGIITGMSIPLIQNIQYRNEQRKYLQYGKAMLSAAKIYRDSYDDDLFGRKRIGCATVSLSQLIEKKLIKDFPDPNISCKDDRTVVQIVKINKQYGYSYRLVCGKDSDSFEEKSVLNSKRINNYSLNQCKNVSKVEITANSEPSPETLAESHNVTISMKSFTGIHPEYLDIEYAWIPVNNLDNSDDVHYNNPGVVWKRLHFLKSTVSSIAKQKEKIISADYKGITFKSEVVVTPDEAPEYYALVLRVNSLNNIMGEKLEIEDVVDVKYRIFRTYNVGKKYMLTYDSNGGSDCNPKSVSILQNKDNNSATLENVNLCSTNKNDSIFKEWNTKKDGTGNRIDNSSIITNNITVYAQWVPKTSEKITFKIQLDNSDHITEKTTGNNGVTYTWGRNGNILTRQVANGTVSDFTYTLLKGKNVTMDLPNYNYNKYINIFRNYNIADGDVAWKCVSGCKNKNQVLSQYSTAIKDTSEIFNSNNVVIRVNWRPTQINIRYKLIGGDTIDNTGHGFKNINGYVATNNSIMIQKVNYDGVINLLDYNNSSYLSVKHGKCTIPKTGHEWINASTKITYDHNKDYKALDMCSDLKNGDCTIDLRVNWIPNKPTLSGTKSSWVNKNYNIEATTTTTNNVILGRLYSKEKNGSYIAGGSGVNSYKFTMSTDSNTQKNTTWYVRACNTFAKDGNDSANCSDFTSTNVKIDKIKPTLEGYNVHAIESDRTILVSSECSGNTKKTGTCNSSFIVPCKIRGMCNWGWDWSVICSDEESGCDTSSRQTIWDFGSPQPGANPSYPGRCGDYKKNKWVAMSYDSSTKKYSTSCKYNYGEYLRHTKNWAYFRQKDKAGNYSDTLLFYSTAQWCAEVPSACR